MKPYGQLLFENARPIFIEFRILTLQNVLFSYIGSAIYKSYFCCERRKKQFNILNILIEELKVLETYCHTKNFKCNMLTLFMNKLCR